MTASPIHRAAVYRHKFQPPATDRQLVPRSKLLQRIDDNPSISCVLIQAPAGHGKTTSLRQIAEHSKQAGHRTAWLTLDEADNDLYRLLAHLDQMISSIEETVDTPQSPEHSDASLPKGWADRCNSRLQDIGAPVHLFFDDFQAIEEREVENLFRDVLRQLPPSAKIVIASRSMPNIGIPELQLRQRVLLLRYDELKFSMEEARQFFEQQRELSLSEDELFTIYSRSEGWPAALQLFRLTLSKKSVKESLSNLESYTPFQITEYLASNVLQSQPAPIQEFLLKCSLLPRLNAPLCDAVSDRDDSQELLLQMERGGLFLNNIDSEMYWFQFHGLFAHYLQELCARKYPDIARTVHRRAASWFFAHGLFEDSLYHAIEAQDYTTAAQAMDIWAGEQITNACLHSVERWADRIPLEAITQRPALAVKITWALTFLRRRSKVLPYLELLRNLDETAIDQQFQVERQITMAVVEMALDHLDVALSTVEGIDTADHEATDFWAFELGAAANIQAFREIALGNFAAARYHIAVGRNHSQEGKAPFPAGYNTGLAIISAYLQGRVQESHERSVAALMAEGLDIEESYAAAAAVCCTLYSLYERNDIDTAIDVFERYRNDIDTGLLLDFVAAAYLPMIRIYDARGEPGKAENLLEVLEDIGISAKWPRLHELCGWETVRRALLRGDTATAQALAARLPQQRQPARWLTFADAIEDPGLSALRLRVHTGADDAVDRQLHEEILAARDRHRVPREIKLRLLSAIARQQQGQAERAQQELKVALTLALDYGFVRTVCDEGPAVTALLQAARSAPWPVALTRYVNTLLAQPHSGADAGAAIAGGQPLEALTAREMQMLTLLAKGEPNKTIARQLFVSENTVKFHLKNIYHKLGVSTRTQAISTAMAMGLI